MSKTYKVTRNFIKYMVLAIVFASIPVEAQSNDLQLDEQKTRVKIDSLLADFKSKPNTVKKGELLFLVGQVLGTDGKPMLNTQVIIWQTDYNGVYDHPNDPLTEKRDRNFKFFGVAKTDEDGWYVFRTIIPAEYPSRPRHIHYKVMQKNKTLLTSQFYFSEDSKELEGESMYRAVGRKGKQLLLLSMKQEGSTLSRGSIYILNGERLYSPTPAQAEGPFFPVRNLKNFDNDLVD